MNIHLNATMPLATQTRLSQETRPSSQPTNHQQDFTESLSVSPELALASFANQPVSFGMRTPWGGKEPEDPDVQARRAKLKVGGVDITKPDAIIKFLIDAEATHEKALSSVQGKLQAQSKRAEDKGQELITAIGERDEERETVRTLRAENQALQEKAQGTKIKLPNLSVEPILPPVVKKEVNRFGDHGENSLGVSETFLQDLVLKLLLQIRTPLSASQICKELGIPDRISQPITEYIKKDVSTGVGLFKTSGSDHYVLTTKGLEEARRVYDANHYTDVIPVPLKDFAEAIEFQTANTDNAYTQDKIDSIFNGLVANDDTFVERVSPSIFQKFPFLLQGPPGTGKTTIAQMFEQLNEDKIIAVPRFVDINGKIARFYDPNKHTLVYDPLNTEHKDEGGKKIEMDPRWVLIQAPTIYTSVEMTPDDLDFHEVEGAGYYRFPNHLLALLGTLILNEHGRQGDGEKDPKRIINRLMDVLDNDKVEASVGGVHFSLPPIGAHVIANTNLEINQIDPAAQRRLSLFTLDSPTEETFKQILKLACDKGVILKKIKPGKTRSITFKTDDRLFNYISQKYKASKIEYRASDPGRFLREMAAAYLYQRSGNPDEADAITSIDLTSGNISDDQLQRLVDNAWLNAYPEATAA